MLIIEHSPVCASREVLGGTLVFRGTRVPAQTLLDYLNDGYSVDQFIEFFPSVERDEAMAFLQLTQEDDHHF